MISSPQGTDRHPCALVGVPVDAGALLVADTQDDVVLFRGHGERVVGAGGLDDLFNILPVEPMVKLEEAPNLAASVGLQSDPQALGNVLEEIAVRHLLIKEGNLISDLNKTKAEIETTLPLEEVPRLLRLTHAMCYYAVQSAP